MSLPLHQQIIECIEKSKSLLIVLKPDPSLDAVVSALAIQKLLHSHQKQTTIVSERFTPPKSLQFIPDTQQIHTDIPPTQKYVVKVPLGDTKIKELSYDLKETDLLIYLTPKNGVLTGDKISFEKVGDPIDTIITLDMQDLESLGKTYADHTDLFYNIPVINIDHSPANEQFGQINCVDITASSIAELLFDVCKEKYPLTEEASHLLLAGIISKTKNFKQTNLTPKVLNIVAQLIEKGAKREEIVHHLYQTKALSTIKLWGRILARLKVDKSIAWSSITREDFIKSGVNSEQNLEEIIDEFISTHLQTKTIFLFYESIKQNVGVIVYHPQIEEMQTKFAVHQPTLNRPYLTFFVKEKKLADVEKEIMEMLIEKKTP